MVSSSRWFARSCVLIVFGISLAWTGAAAAVVAGDQNGDGELTVSDIQILILMSLGQALPESLDADANGVVDGCEQSLADFYQTSFESAWAELTSCDFPAVTVPTPVTCADLNGDEAVDVSDIVVDVLLVLQVPLASAVDADMDGIPDGWAVTLATIQESASAAASEAAAEYEAGCSGGCEIGELCCGGACVAVQETDNPCGAVACDDEIACTVDYCDLELGCSAWPDSRRCGAGQLCSPGPTADPNGCVDAPAPPSCEEGNVVAPMGAICGVAPEQEGDVWSPPGVGDTIECSVRFAAGDLACADTWLGCFLHSLVLPIGWTANLQPTEVVVPTCAEGECVDWTIPFSLPNESAVWAPSGIRYKILEATSNSDWENSNFERIYVRFPTLPTYSSGGVTPGQPNWAYLSSEGQILGEPTLFVARFLLTEAPKGWSDTAICLGDPIVNGHKPAGYSNEDWQDTRLDIAEGDLLVSSPGQGWECNDFELCTTDVFVPGVGCLFDPLTPEECDDGIWCTYDACSKTTGECNHLKKNGDKQCPTWGDFCIVDSPFANPETGCVHDMWSHTCWAGGVLCELSETIHWAESYGPEEGDYFICPVRMARSMETCPNPKNGWRVPHLADLHFGFDPNTLDLIGAYDTVCYPGVGCFLQPWVDYAGEYALDTGHVYVGGPDPEFWDVLGWFRVGTVSFSGLVPLADAYLDASGQVIGNADLFELWFKLHDGVSFSAPTTVCLEQTKIGNVIMKDLPYELAGDGLIVLYPPEP